MGQNMASNIRIVLIKTWHSGNIGAAARAMKNMGVYDLVLVDPVDFPSEEATNRAGQATDILESARVVETLEEAIQDCTLVIGTSARNRSIPLPSITAEDCAERSVKTAKTGPVAIVFGRERTGLHNHEIQQCQFQLNIDANPDYPVLNLSQAVQLVCYELFKAQYQEDNAQSQVELGSVNYPTQEALTHFYTHLEATAKTVGFLNSAHPGQTMDHLKALFRKANPTQKELSILRGFLSKIEQSQDS